MPTHLVHVVIESGVPPFTTQRPGLAPAPSNPTSEHSYPRDTKPSTKGFPRRHGETETKKGIVGVDRYLVHTRP